MSLNSLPDTVSFSSNENSPNTISNSKTTKPVKHEFKNVRVQLSSSTTNVGVDGKVQGKVNKSETLIFIDAKNSINVDDYEIKKDDIVITDDGNFKVVAINVLKPFNSIHHWEITIG